MYPVPVSRCGALVPPAALIQRKRSVDSRLAWRHLLLALMLLLGAAMLPAAAAERSTGHAGLDAARRSIDDIQKVLAGAADPARLPRLRADALDARLQSEAAVLELSPQLARVQARLLQLGAMPAGAAEAPNVAAERADLEKSRGALDAQVKLARLMAVEAEQMAVSIAALRRQQFQAQLGERTASILGDRFWNEVRQDLPEDLAHLSALGRQLAAAFSQVAGWKLALALVVLLLIAGARYLIDRRLMRLTATHVPPSRLRRSLHAVVVVLLWVATVGLSVIAASLVFGRQMLVDVPGAGGAALASLPWLLLSALSFGAYVAGLGQALLSPDRPSWRLPALPDAVAQGLRWFAMQLAVLISLVWIAEGLASLLDASLAATVAINCIMALAIGLSLALAIVRGAQLQRSAAQADPAARRPFWLMALLGAGWLVLAISLVGLLAGYVAFGSFVVKQAVWTLVVLATAYLLAAVAEDGFKALLMARSADGAASEDASAAPIPVAAAGTSPAATDGSSVSTNRVGEQAAVLLSGIARLVVALLALMLLLAPFGEGPAELFRRTDQLQNSLNIGKVNIQPAAVLQGLLVLALALIAAKVLQRWLQNSYLPTTRLDPGMRASASTLLGYVGYVCAISLAMSAVGIGLDRIAWVASALSVGIGFGLQAVVQNFVSGLILLAERPVRVGDWVSLGGVEGDIRSINMRATQIQLGDRSTVIVPNSEFITKTVRNVTHDNPMGLVQIKLPMPLSSDADAVRQLLLAVFQSNSDVLATPPANVQLDGIEGGSLVFNATGYVASPRAAYGVRSALLFKVLEQLGQAGIEMAKPPTLIAMPGPGQAAPQPLPQTPLEPASPMSAITGR